MERVVKRLEGVSHDSAYYIALAQKCLDNHGKIIDPGAITDKANDFSKNYFEHNPHFYINPTEKLCMQALVGQGDKVATVLGSGDFALDAVYQGASRVDTFDINEYQEALASIKIASAGLMSYQDYMSFYSDPLSAKYLEPFLFKKVQKLNLEGIVIKNKNGFYHINERTDDFIKVKNIHENTFYIGGYIKNKTSYSLLIGEFINDNFIYLGKVVVNKSDQIITKIKSLNKIKNPFVNYSNNGIFIKPILKCKIAYLEKTNSNKLRHPIFRGETC